MRIETWDTGFIRSRRSDVHSLLADPGRWGEWWPGLRVRSVDEQRWKMAFRPPGLWARPHRLEVVLGKVRPDLGVRLGVAGGVQGEIEFFYIDEPNGVFVHYLARLEVQGASGSSSESDSRPPRAARRLSTQHRAAARAGLNAMKDRLEAGRQPGQEPDPRLLADQQEAIAAYRAGVEAHARRQAATREEASE